jgi:hypothetical protein
MTWDEKFEEFHTKNPHVYDMVVKLAREVKNKGHNRIAIELLWNQLRWQHLMTNDPNTPFKLNQNYKSRYARLIMAQESDLEGVFEIRRLRS